MYENLIAFKRKLDDKARNYMLNDEEKGILNDLNTLFRNTNDMSTKLQGKNFKHANNSLAMLKEGVCPYCNRKY